MSTYRWLSPDAPSAIALCEVPRLPALLDRPLPAAGRACLAHLCNAQGQPVDEVVVLGHATHVEIHAHGGPGVRQAIADALAGHGLWAAASGADAAWEIWAGLVHPAALPYLAVGQQPPGVPASRLCRPFQVLLCGRANAGKSTLLNAWSGHARALVDAAPGTTRDLVWVDLLLQGWAVRLADSAGLRGASGDPAEEGGQALVQAARAGADAVLWLDAPQAVGTAQPQTGDLIIQGKADLRAAWPTALAWASPQAVGEARAAELLHHIEVQVLKRLKLV